MIKRMKNGAIAKMKNQVKKAKMGIGEKAKMKNQVKKVKTENLVKKVKMIMLLTVGRRKNAPYPLAIAKLSIFQGTCEIVMDGAKNTQEQ